MCQDRHNCGDNKIPWNFVLHALREGLNINEHKTYTLQDKDYKAYPQLRELVDQLKTIV
jgi:hypothetical protein